MKVTFLGTGTSQGVPIIGCTCSVCKSNDSKDQRLRSSIWIHDHNLSLIIDSGPDFRQQVLRAKITQLDGILFTHHHKDHTGGLDDVRAFNYLQKSDMPIYGEAYVMDSIKQEFAYAFAPNPYPGVPKIKPIEIDTQMFSIQQLDITPIRGYHHRLPVLGFRIGNWAYLTDMNRIEKQEIEKLKGLDVLIINALRLEKHLSHFTLEEALSVIEECGAKQAYLTHISHDMGLHQFRESTLPPHVHLAYDGLEIEIPPKN